MSSALHALLLLLLLFTGVLALQLRSLAHSIAAFCLFCLLLALEFYVLNAPDAAMAEAVIGAGLSTTLFVVAYLACRKRVRGGGQ
ncbi:MAG: DUF4040 domain-containing protein [Fretibacterium sp.]|nr:DUF4040 domain-containing protein [Fretibacterium sp.]